ncbi:MAG: 50S ribosomal protein L6 [Bacteriovoracaceae bacterium]|nr:50S ribosomal protein L6 [Bacteriovoracaceae bacterium]
MSRIGKKIIEVKGKTEAKVDNGNIIFSGPKGKIEMKLPDGFELKKIEGGLELSPTQLSSGKSNSKWGLYRTIIANNIHGVTDGFSKDLEFTGVGYRAAVAGSMLTLNLGFSHPIEFQLPKGIEAKVDKNKITVSGFDKELVGLVSAKIRGFRPPEPYKGKGIKYSEEKIIRKAGKTSAKK